jgi:hypothetical protein
VPPLRRGGKCSATLREEGFFVATLLRVTAKEKGKGPVSPRPAGAGRRYEPKRKADPSRAAMRRFGMTPGILGRWGRARSGSLCGVMDGKQKRGRSGLLPKWRAACLRQAGVLRPYD